MFLIKRRECILDLKKRAELDQALELVKTHILALFGEK